MTGMRVFPFVLGFENLQWGDAALAVSSAAWPVRCLTLL